MAAQMQQPRNGNKTVRFAENTKLNSNSASNNNGDKNIPPKSDLLLSPKSAAIPLTPNIIINVPPPAPPTKNTNTSVIVVNKQQSNTTTDNNNQSTIAANNNNNNNNNDSSTTLLQNVVVDSNDNKTATLDVINELDEHEATDLPVRKDTMNYLKAILEPNRKQQGDSTPMMQMLDDVDGVNVPKVVITDDVINVNNNNINKNVDETESMYESAPVYEQLNNNNNSDAMSSTSDLVKQLQRQLDKVDLGEEDSQRQLSSNNKLLNGSTTDKNSALSHKVRDAKKHKSTSPKRSPVISKASSTTSSSPVKVKNPPINRMTESAILKSKMAKSSKKPETSPIENTRNDENRFDIDQQLTVDQSNTIIGVDKVESDQQQKLELSTATDNNNKVNTDIDKDIVDNFDDHNLTPRSTRKRSASSITLHAKSNRAYRLMKEEIARRGLPTKFEKKNFVDLSLEDVLLPHSHSTPDLNHHHHHHHSHQLDSISKHSGGSLTNLNLLFPPNTSLLSPQTGSAEDLKFSTSEENLAKTIADITKTIDDIEKFKYVTAAGAANAISTTAAVSGKVAGVAGSVVSDTNSVSTTRRHHGKVGGSRFSSGTRRSQDHINRFRFVRSKSRTRRNSGFDPKRELLSTFPQNRQELALDKYHKLSISARNKKQSTAAENQQTDEVKADAVNNESNENALNSEADKKLSVSSVENQVQDSRTNATIKLLNLAKEGNWQAVENVLRTSSMDEYNFDVTDDKGFALIHLATKDSRYDIVDKLIKFGVNIRTPTTDGRQLAHIAAMYARHEMIRYLIAHSVDVSQPAGTRRQFPLHLACMRSNAVDSLPVVQLLLANTAADNRDPRLLDDKYGCIPLLLASEASNPAVAKELLLKIPQQQINWQRKDSGDTALHFACMKRDEELGQALIDARADANIKNVHGQTPLHIVTAIGDENMLRLLYMARANPDIADNSDRTPLHIAAEHGRTNMVEILTDKFKASILARTKDGSTLMHVAAGSGHASTALACLKRGVPLDMPNRNGALGLHSAALAGHVGVVKTLLDRGTHVDAQTKDNYTALHVAVQAGKARVVEALLGYGANVHFRGGTLGETALHLAAALTGQEGAQCAEMLIKSGAEVNVTQENGETALHIAARTGNTEMIKLLLSEEADPMLTSKVGESAVHIAAKFCHKEACRLILQFVESSRRREDAVVLVNKQTESGETALHYAADISPEMVHYKSEDTDLVRLLLDYGGEVNYSTSVTQETPIHRCARTGNINVLSEIIKKIGPGAVQIVLNKQDHNGWSPLLIAADKGHNDIVKLLLQHNARVDVFDEDGNTTLHMAAKNGHADICDILLQSKAFVNSKTKLGSTPLHFAAMNGHGNVVQTLIEKHGAFIDGTTNDNRTALHVAAKYGQLQICSLLLSLGANSNAKDSRGQTPLHLAAESDYPEVVKVFLRMKPEMSTLTATDENGFTCAHIAAMKGSVAVIRELLNIDKEMVTHAVTKTTESTTLHLAAAGGHRHVVRILMENGAIETSENANGMTPLHLAAKFGHVGVLDMINKRLWNYCSGKTGLTPLLVASHFGQLEFVRYMLGVVPATQKSEPPLVSNPLMVKELQYDYGFTALHFASQSGHEGLVRLLLNFPGVQVEVPSTIQSVTPLHLAAMSGDLHVVGMLLSRSTTQLQLKDARGRTSIHMAANNGHYDMVALLIGQGSNINAMDNNGWTALHLATKTGHLNVVRLLIESGADCMAETKDAKVPITFAASSNHYHVLSYLMHHDHDTHQLMDDRKFVFDLMVTGKSHHYKPIEDFVLLSPAPIDTAVKLSSVYHEISSKEKERSKDLESVAEFCEDIASELLSIAATDHTAPSLLNSIDHRGRPFLDVLIENEQKRVVAHASVQRYLTEVWNGNLHWSTGKYVCFMFAMVLLPPVWIFFSIPFRIKACRAPQIKFICHLVSHTYLTIMLIIEVLCWYQKIYAVESVVPNALEVILLIWISGMLVSELSNPNARTGLAIFKIIMLFMSAIGALLHVGAFLYPCEMAKGTPDPDVDQFSNCYTFLWLRNQMISEVLLLAFVHFLEFMTVHHLFGPWTIIIRDIIYDLARFLVILVLFFAGFAFAVTALYQSAFNTAYDPNIFNMMQHDPGNATDMLFHALFGLANPPFENMPPELQTPYFSRYIMKMVIGMYFMVIFIVLITLFIAMMSDTYQRIQAQSDIEWKFGRAILIRQLNKLANTPPPLNIITKLYIIGKVAWRNKLNICSTRAQEDLRHEENMDSFTMTGTLGGRSTPPPQPTIVAHVPASTAVPATAGRVVAISIDKVIDWKHVVDTYFIFQGISTTTDGSGTSATVTSGGLSDLGNSQQQQAAAKSMSNNEGIIEMSISQANWAMSRKKLIKSSIDDL